MKGRDCDYRDRPGALAFVALLAAALVCASACDKKPKQEQAGNVFDEHKKCFGAGSKTVNLTTLDWQPYIGADMQDFGPNHEVVVTAFNRVGYKVCTAFFTWERTHKLGVEGEDVDGYFPEYYSEDYENELYFSGGYPAGPAGFYKRRDKDLGFRTALHMSDFRALTPYRIGVVRGYVNTAPLDEAIGQFVEDIADPAERAAAQKKAYLYANRDQADSDVQNLVKLYNDRIQVVFIDPNVARYHMNKTLEKRYADVHQALEFMEPPLIIHKVYTCISRKTENAKQKLDDFNRGLDLITRDGTLRKIYEKHGFTTVDGVNFKYDG